MSTPFDVRAWARQAGIQTTGGFAVVAECVTLDELQLRRLHAVNAELLEALRNIVNLWDHHASAHGDGIVSPLHEAARAAIAKAEAA